MSEDEQSWTYGGEHKKLALGRLLVSAMVLTRPNERWPMGTRDFALAVNACAAKGNIVAKRIPVYNGVVGFHCPDFDGALSMALHACLIEYLSPSYTEMILNAGPRTVRQLLRDETEAEIEAAKELVTEFWYITRGGRPVEPPPAEAS